MQEPTAKMNVCWCIAISVALSVLFLGSSCTAVEGEENDLLDKLHKHNTAKGGLKHVLTNDGPLVKSDRLRELSGRDHYIEIKDDLQGLSKTVKGMQAEYDLLEKVLSKQRTNVEEMDQKLLAIQNDIKKIQGNILLVTGTMEQLVTEIHAVKNDTRKLEVTASNINTLVQQLLSTDKERTAQINKLEAVTIQLISAVSLESLNKTIQDLIPAAVMSDMDDLRQQISELKSALESNRVTQVAKPAPMKAMDGLQEALLQISELKEKCVSKDELSHWMQNVTTVREARESQSVVNKCSVNVRHEPREGRTHLRLVMDPPNTDSANCK